MVREGKRYFLWMEEVGIEDVSRVGGKNASLGEMLRYVGPKGVHIPSGFIVTADAYRYFLKSAGLEDYIQRALAGLNTRNVRDLAIRGAKIRTAIKKARMPEDIEKGISQFYVEMERKYETNIDVAVRSSATAEDLPDASFAGEHETYLGIRGAGDVTTAVKSAMASLFTDRAISYRVDKGFDHFKIALSVAVQRMVRAESGASGVLFTLDTESGFRDVVLINASYGLGEMVVQGKVSPDEYLIFKKNPFPILSKRIGGKAQKMIYAKGRGGIHPVKIVSTTPREREQFVLTDEDILTLARWGMIIEEHYSRKRSKWVPMDIEWARDGRTGELFIVQARPETVQAGRDFTKLKEYIRRKDGKIIAKGVSVGSKIAVGKARVILDAKNIAQFKKGEVLVTDMTDPDWEPIMKIASAIVTDKGGRTSHAAIVSRELGIPAVVGAEVATRKIKTGTVITVDTIGSEGFIFEGALPFDVVEHDLTTIPKTKTKVMVNIATPDTAFEKSFLPATGVGLAREEFIIASEICVHPLALIHYARMKPALKRSIDLRTKGWNDKTKFYIDNLAYGIAKIGAAFHPRPVIVRFSDFKTNEYRALLGGELYEPEEENPMIGWRGASRYYNPKFEDAFRLECRAIKKTHDEMGLENIIPMIPFCRTIEEARRTLNIMADEGLLSAYSAKQKNLTSAKTIPVYVMCEIPSNVLLADEFLDIFDGMSIGSNDLTQLALGLDRDSGIVSHISNENDATVKKLIETVIEKCRARSKYIGICGQGPSDLPDFAEFLIEKGIESVSLNPDTVIKALIVIAEKEKQLGVRI